MSRGIRSAWLVRALPRPCSLNARRADPVTALGVDCVCVLVPTHTMQVLATVVRAEADRDLTFKPANSNKKLVRHAGPSTPRVADP